MSTTAKIDFEPGLFDEGQPEAAPDLPTIQPKRRTNRAPFIVAGGLLLVLAVAFFALNTTSKPKTVPAGDGRENGQNRTLSMRPVRLRP